MLPSHFSSVKEARLMVSDAEFLVNGSYYALHLTQRKHTSEEGIACIVAPLLVAQHCHAVVHAHRQQCCWAVRALLLDARLLLLLKDMRQFHQVGTASQMACLRKVAIREDVA